MGTGHLTWFNELPVRAAQLALLECCAAPGWADEMTARRPYSSAAAAVQRSDEIVAAMSVVDLAEALAGHPRIGAPPDAGQNDSKAANWASQEQSGVDAADAETSRALAAANLEYEQRFGHIYLVCASGLTGTELLALLRDRLQNEPDDEWRVVRAELQKINALRLQRFLAEAP